jgi:hypothetical protein
VHEGVLDAMQERLDRMPIRRQTVEHPFGTMKARMGATHFLTRALATVRTEMSLRVLEHFPTKWMPVRRRKCGKIKNLENFAIATRS